MAGKYYFIINLLIFTVAQFYLISRYATQRKSGKTVQSLLSYLVVTALLLYEYNARLNLPGFVITCSILTVIGHSLIGDYLGYYYKSKIYDRYLHSFGTFSFTLLVFSGLNHMVAPFGTSQFYTSLFVVTLGISIGTLFEILEFIHDSFSKKIACQHGLTDTNFDMIFNFFGAIIAGLVTPYFL